MKQHQSHASNRGIIAALFLGAALPLFTPALPPVATAYVTGTVAPYADRLAQARQQMESASVLMSDTNPTVRGLMATNIGRHGMEFPELAPTAFDHLALLMSDHNFNVAAEAAWQAGLLGNKYEDIGQGALTIMSYAVSLKNDGNVKKSLNIVDAATAIGRTHASLARSAFNVLNAFKIPADAEPGDHRNHVIRDAARGMAGLAVKYPALTQDVLNSLKNLAMQTKDADIAHGIVEGAGNIGLNPTTATAKAQAREILTFFKKHEDNKARRQAEYYIGQMSRTPVSAPAAPQRQF